MNSVDAASDPPLNQPAFVVDVGVSPMSRVSFASILVTALLLAAPLSFASDDTRPATTALEHCWSPAALRAKPSEKATRYRRVGTDLAGLRKLLPRQATPVPAAMQGSIRRVELPPGRKLIAITFDLCETPFSIAGYDGPIVDYLRGHDIRATFFASGKWLETHQERAQQLIADPRFELGNHGFVHRDFRRLGGKALSDEILLAQVAYARTRNELKARTCFATPTAPTIGHAAEQMTLFRFPYGTCNANALQAVGRQGLLAIQWDVVSGDPDRRRSARSIAAGVLANVKPGSIIVAHANGRGWNMGKALPLIIPKLKAQGYEFVTVSELLAAGKPVIAQSCYQLRPGDNAHVGPVARHRKKRKGPSDRELRALLKFPD